MCCQTQGFLDPAAGGERLWGEGRAERLATCSTLSLQRVHFLGITQQDMCVPVVDRYYDLK